MARKEAWEREAHEAVKREAWSLSGPNQILKVCAAGGSAASRLGGYITLRKFLINKNPSQIERALGLPPLWLANGARIYRFLRLPQSSEYEYDLTAAFPGGLAFTSYSNPSYPPGDRTIHQWKINPGVTIPVDPISCLVLAPGEVFTPDKLM
jgi:hypothetical protein